MKKKKKNIAAYLITFFRKMSKNMSFILFMIIYSIKLTHLISLFLKKKQHKHITNYQMVITFTNRIVDHINLTSFLNME